MAETSQILSDLMPCAAPSDADIVAWQSLSRDEQLRRLRALLGHPDSFEVIADGMSDLLVLAHARSDAKKRE